MIRFADFPQAPEVWPQLDSLEHIAAELHHVIFHSFWLNFCEGRMDMSHAFFDEMIHPAENRHRVQRAIIPRGEGDGLIGQRGQQARLFRLRAHPMLG